MLRRIGFAAAVVCGLLAAVGARGETNALAELRGRFCATEAPIDMEYQLGYRFLNMEVSRLGVIRLTTTGGLWKHRVSGVQVPVVFIDVQVDSNDRRAERARNRISIHDEMIAVLTLPELHALVFSKYTDEYLNPIFGRCKVSRAVSIYDTQSGAMEYVHRDLTAGGTVTTNLSHPEDMLTLSRQLRPIMDYLIGQCRTNTDGAVKGRDQISVNLDGQVVTLRLAARPERSPACLGRQRIDALRIETVPVGKRQVRAREFYSWAMPFASLADFLNDDALRASARSAMVESMVPLVVDYELAIGRIRAALVSVGQDGACPPVADQAGVRPAGSLTSGTGPMAGRNGSPE